MIKYTVKVYPFGTKEWFLNHQLHRTDGPAVELADGSKFWYLNDQRHRTDGPAIEYADGNKWFVDGVSMTEQEHQAAMNPVEEMTMEDICKALGKTVKVKK
jgi:hypothetical protein